MWIKIPLPTDLGFTAVQAYYSRPSLLFPLLLWESPSLSFLMRNKTKQELWHTKFRKGDLGPENLSKADPGRPASPRRGSRQGQPGWGRRWPGRVECNSGAAFLWKGRKRSRSGQCLFLMSTTHRMWASPRSGDTGWRDCQLREFLPK